MKSREPAELSERFQKRWSGYAAAARARGCLDTQGLLARGLPAGAVALGLLGGAEVAFADSIVYTPANITIQTVCILSGGCGSFSERRGSLGIDLNHDGVNDVNLVQSSVFTLDANFRGLRLQSGSVTPGPLSKGAVIGPGRTFVRGPLSMAYGATNFYPICTHTCSGPTFRYGGPWRNVDGFMGIQFQIDGATHFGWAEFDVTWPVGPFVSATLEGYAYDTVAGQSIEAGQTTSAPEPGTLGLLALGSLGIGLWSRRRAASTQ